MAPEQLDALAGRVRRRREQVPVAGEDQENRPKFDGRITIVVAGTDDARPMIEALLAQHAKKFELVRSSMGEGETTFVYAVRARKGQRLADVAETVRVEGVPFVGKASAEQWI